MLYYRECPVYVLKGGDDAGLVTILMRLASGAITDNTGDDTGDDAYAIKGGVLWCVGRGAGGDWGVLRGLVTSSVKGFVNVIKDIARHEV